jgi:hypothetical protein
MIYLKVNSDGTISAGPKFSRGDLVQWSVEGGAASVTINFGGSTTTPFSTDPLSSASASVEAGIRADAALGHYPYTVYVNGTPCPGSPEIVVG